MGFFSSRKSDTQVFIEPDKSVVRVIRSRFYGKEKEKDRQSESASPLRSPLRKEQKWDDSTPPPNHRHSRISQSGNNATPTRTSTDAVTITLTQRLNELAVANSEGLLGDDEYRLLRQNLFERFASGNVVPTEAPLVPLGNNHPRRSDGRPSTSQRPTSANFQVATPRSPSVRSKSSMTSAVSGLFRLSTSRRSDSVSKVNDASSEFSTGSSASNLFFPRKHVPRKASDISIHTETSRSPFDTLSISSRLTGATSDAGSPTKRSLSKSASRRRTPAPPSSYPLRSELRSPSSGNLSDMFDEENLETANDIRRQIELVEAEGRRLLDSFNGLELSTLTRRQQQPKRLLVPISPGGGHSTSTLVPRRRHERQATESDTQSTLSSISSAARSSRRQSSQSPLVSQPITLRRKISISSVSSRSRSTTGPLTPTPSFGRLTGASSSSVNLMRSSSHLPLTTVSEGSNISPNVEDVELLAMETELADIRRRRQEVTSRYEARLEYLRAKLKGAELHEKLLRK